MPVIHQSSVGAIFLDRDDINGTPYEKLTVRQGRAEASLHLNQATLLSVASVLIEQANKMNEERIQSAAADDANIRTPDAETL
jgi:hypothetical protein